VLNLYPLGFMETTTSTRPTITSTALRYGLLVGLASIVFSFILIATNQLGNSLLGLVSLAIAIVGIVLAQRDFRARNGGFMSYGEGLGIGALLSLVSGVLSSIFSFVYRVIDPSAFDGAIEQARAKMEAAGTMSDAQIDQAMTMSQKFSTGPIGFVVGIVGAVFIGTLLSLVISAILKNAKPEFD
jgi:hypothetical protein